MLDIDTLQFRSSLFQEIRTFFSKHSYIELDTPSLSPALIPDASSEVFRTFYDDPWTEEEKPVFAVPSHEYFLKKAVTALKVPVFQLSKCFRNSISADRLNSPEFTMLEFYTPGASYVESAAFTEALISSLSPMQKGGSTDNASESAFKAPGFQLPRPPYQRITMDEAFKTYAGFALSDCTNAKALAVKVRELGIPEFPDNPFDDWPVNELFELVLSQRIEPALPYTGVFIYDQPSFVPSLAKAKEVSSKKQKNYWKEQWSLYVAGIKIAVSRSEETDTKKIKAFLENEGRNVNAAARIKPTLDLDFWKTVKELPVCSGVELNIDRLIMVLSGEKSIENIVPFPFRLKTGYY